jgi:hypothetical protein
MTLLDAAAKSMAILLNQGIRVKGYMRFGMEDCPTKLNKRPTNSFSVGSRNHRHGRLQDGVSSAICIPDHC